MTRRELNPSRLDVEAFAKDAAQLEGDWPLARFARLADGVLSPTSQAAARSVVWKARGELRRPRSGEAQPWLHLEARTCVALECQRCLQPVAVALALEREFRFVHGESQAAEIDAESEEDVLASSRTFDLAELLEDELLLALPLVPRHDVCPEPLPVTIDEEASLETVNPFSALAALKRGRSAN